MSRSPGSRALGDITVLDLTHMRAGPTCVRQLADWGANVIKIEAPVSADRKGTQTDFSPRHDSDFQNLQRNKRSMTLDLKSEQGVAIFHRLAKGADVIVENFRPDVKFRLGIEYAAIEAVNPRVIYASISGYGQDGPYRDRPGVDPIAQGMAGIMSVTGEPDGPPQRAGIAFVDTTAGLFGALGILTALHERTNSGHGQWVQTSLLQSAVFMLDFQAARYLMKGEVPGRIGNHHPSAAPLGTFKARDGYINVAPTPTMWARFCTALEREDLIGHPDFSTPALRVKNRAQVNQVTESLTMQFDVATLVEHLNGAGIPCGPVYTIDQTFADPQVRHLHMAQTVTSDALGPIDLVGQPFTLNRTPSGIKAAAPELGQHTEEILAEFGYGEEEIRGFRQAGTI